MFTITPMLGPHPLAHRADLARPVGAHLGHEHLGARRQVLVERAGQAAGVVEAGRAGQHRALPGDEVADVELRGRLAVRAGDGDGDGRRRPQSLLGRCARSGGRPAARTGA